jgi:hypothetical protein
MLTLTVEMGTTMVGTMGMTLSARPLTVEVMRNVMSTVMGEVFQVKSVWTHPSTKGKPVARTLYKKLQHGLSEV